MKRDGSGRRRAAPCVYLTTCFCFLIFFLSASFMLAQKGHLHLPASASPSQGRWGSRNAWLGGGEDSSDDLEDGGEDKDDDDDKNSAGRGLAFTSTVSAFRKWDVQAGCAGFRAQHAAAPEESRSAFLQDPNAVSCSDVKQKHVSVLVKAHTWIPDNLNSLYACDCGLSCLWEKSSVLADDPDAHIYETYKPPAKRRKGDPLRVYIELEPLKQPASQDIFVSYHHEDTIQATYAGASFHTNRNYYISTHKNPDILVYWSSSRCVIKRQAIASSFLPLVPHHSFGKCLNNVKKGGKNAIDMMYPRCRNQGVGTGWSTNLHCAMSHYKFVLAIENTFRDSYVTEKLFYAFDAGSVPIYFGAPNVLELVPPNSIIVGDSFKSMAHLATYVKQLAENPVKYAEFHAWRRCGVMGNYMHTRAVSLDSLPCRLCAIVSSMGGKNSSSGILLPKILH